MSVTRNPVPPPPPVGQNCSDPECMDISSSDSSHSPYFGGDKIGKSFFRSRRDEREMREGDDGDWESVWLPHDFVVEGEPTPLADMAHGYLPYGRGWYRFVAIFFCFDFLFLISSHSPLFLHFSDLSSRSIPQSRTKAFGSHLMESIATVSTISMGFSLAITHQDIHLSISLSSRIILQ